MRQPEITSLYYNPFEGQLYAKFFNNNQIAPVKWNYTFFGKKDFFKTNAMYTVSPSDKVHFFTNEPVDKITLEPKVDTRLFDTSQQSVKDNLYLYDLPPKYQFMLYNNIQPSKNYTVAYMDIETDDSLDAYNAPAPVLMVTLIHKDQTLNKWVIKSFSLEKYPSEERMLKDALRYITKGLFPDIILGWNVKDYDRAYLLNRCKRLKIQIDWNEFQLIEFINGIDIVMKKYGYSILKQTGGMKLDNVAQHFLGRGKIPFSGMFGKLYKSNYELAVKYNIRDVMLVRDLDEKIKLIPFVLDLQAISGVMLGDVFYNSVLIDSMILNRYKNRVYKSRFGKLLDTEEYEGGFVFTPPVGIFENIAGFDVAAMYPSIILTFNTSPDAKDPNGEVTLDDVKFRAKPDGFITETIKELYGKRLALKATLKNIPKGTTEYDNVDSLQTAYKLILNSVYGVMAFKSFRFYDLDVAKSITAAGRKLIKYISTCIEHNQLGKTLYGDTDSIFIQYDKDPNKILDLINKNFIPSFVKAVSTNSENFIQMELKDVYRKMAFFGKKKNYIAQIDDNDFLIRGLSTEKYDTPKPIRKIYDEIIPLLFNDKPFVLATYEAKIRALGVNDLICLKKFNKNKEDYKVVPQHLKALRFSMKHLPLLEDTQHSNLVKMVYVIVDPTKFKGDESDTIIIDENIKTLPEGITINYDKYVEFFLYKKLEDVLKVFNKLDQIPPKQAKPRKPRAKKIKEPQQPDKPDNPLHEPVQPDKPLQPQPKQKIDDIF